MLWEALSTARDLGRMQEIASVLIRHGLGDAVRRIADPIHATQGRAGQPAVAQMVLDDDRVAGDAARLTRIPGVGRKTAERLIVEMRDRVDAAGGLAGGGGVAAPPAGAEGEAFSALVALGYKPAEATQMLKGAGGGTTEERIRRALQGAARE